MGSDLQCSRIAFLAVVNVFIVFNNSIVFIVVIVFIVFIVINDSIIFIESDFLMQIGLTAAVACSYDISLSSEIADLKKKKLDCRFLKKKKKLFRILIELT
jgi:hypothetical protein